MIDSWPINVGRFEDGSDLTVDLVRGGHVVCAGATRSGKSYFAYVLLAGLARTGAVRVMGIDPSRALLRPFADRFPDPLIVRGYDEPEQFMVLMDEWLAEMRRRLDLLDELEVDKLGSFSSSVPLYVIVLEELQGIYGALEAHDKLSGAKVADRLEPRFRSGFKRLAAEAAKCGIRLVVIAQRSDASLFDGYARDQLTQRISFRQEGSDGLRMLFPTLTADELSDFETIAPGTGFAKFPGTRPMKFRADSAGEDGFKAYLAEVRKWTPDKLF